MQASKTIELDQDQLHDFTIAKYHLEKKLGVPVTDSAAVQLLANILSSSEVKVTKIKKPLILKYDPDICPVCKKEFFPSTRAKKTCSLDCRKILYKIKRIQTSSKTREDDNI